MNSRLVNIGNTNMRQGLKIPTVLYAIYPTIFACTPAQFVSAIQLVGLQLGSEQSLRYDVKEMSFV